MAPVILILHYIIRVLILGLLIRAVISWVAPTSRHPAVLLLIRFTDPPLEPIRNLVGVRSGVDFSPLIMMVLLSVIDRLLLNLLG
jgi:YggT family protein